HGLGAVVLHRAEHHARIAEPLGGPAEHVAARLELTGGDVLVVQPPDVRLVRRRLDVDEEEFQTLSPRAFLSSIQSCSAASARQARQTMCGASPSIESGSFATAMLW